MAEYHFTTHTKKILADTITPVSVYLKIRDVFPNSLLLESSDYHANDNSFSYICCRPIASVYIENKTLIQQFPDGEKEEISLDKKSDVPGLIHNFVSKFSSKGEGYKFISNGLFGYLSYDAVQYFEDISIKNKEQDFSIPDLYYAVYQNIIAINHFKNEAYLFCHSLDGSNNLSQIEQLLQSKNIPSYPYANQGTATSGLKDDDFRALVAKAKEHCQRGDVFQLVLSRRFKQAFKGDEFNVYRALRSINPSPYLFYFDYGDFKIFGSSPEAQLVVKNRHAEIHPIAGTFKRTGNDEEDALLAKKLSEDDKENSEHVMLVDLARNDLSRNGHAVAVEKYREVQFFSHVIHLVSKVKGQLHKDTNTLRVVADTFPAGTLSGAPKHMAMTLIDRYENVKRGYYGGAIGFMDFEGNFNHAIMIRTFLSQHHHLYFQAGAGIVAHSDEESENQEVYNKLRALHNAMEMAENI